MRRHTPENIYCLFLPNVNAKHPDKSETKYM